MLRCSSGSMAAHTRCTSHLNMRRSWWPVSTTSFALKLPVSENAPHILLHAYENDTFYYFIIFFHYDAFNTFNLRFPLLLHQMESTFSCACIAICSSITSSPPCRRARPLRILLSTFERSHLMAKLLVSREINKIMK